jgi:hypothetical protein
VEALFSLYCSFPPILQQVKWSLAAFRPPEEGE